MDFFPEKEKWDGLKLLEIPTGLRKHGYSVQQEVDVRLVSLKFQHQPPSHFCSPVDRKTNLHIFICGRHSASIILCSTHFTLHHHHRCHHHHHHHHRHAKSTTIINFKIAIDIFTWLAGRSLQRASPKTHRPMKVERGVRGTDTENIFRKMQQ